MVHLSDATQNEILQEALNLYNYGIEKYTVDIAGSIFERGTPQEIGTLYGDFSKIATATLIASRSRCSVETQRGDADEQSNVLSEVLIEKFSRENGFWFENTDNYFHSKYGKVYAFGSECSVYLDESRQVVIKTMDTESSGSILNTLHRIIIHNALFPETNLNVIGFGRSHFGLFEVIIEQDFVQGRYALQSEINFWLSTMGEVPGDGDFTTDRYFVSDLLPKNVIFCSGALFVVDAYLRFKEGVLE